MTEPSGGPVEAVLAAIDAANASDPRSIDWDGDALPMELVHARRMTHWLGVLDPQASDAQLIAARAHHLRRWTRPRDDFPPGRAGYLRWRKAARAAHAAEVGQIMASHGCDAGLTARVAQIVQKEGLGVDSQVQTHEDALCLTFLELQAAEFLSSRPTEEAERIVAKTVAKMSDQARVIGRTLGLPG